MIVKQATFAYVPEKCSKPCLLDATVCHIPSLPIRVSVMTLTSICDVTSKLSVHHLFTCSLHSLFLAGKPWYGDGVYFAKDASYSMRGWMTGADGTGKEAKLFLVKVLTGKVTYDTMKGLISYSKQ